MDDIAKYIVRLEYTINSSVDIDDSIGLESISDTIRYYFTRLLSNLKFSFSDFSRSELEVYNSKYKSQINSFSKNPLLDLSSIIVSIPKGMINDYHRTISELEDILSDIYSESLEKDLENLYIHLNNSDDHSMNISTMSQKEFDSIRKRIGSLFTTKGLEYISGDKAFKTYKDIGEVNTSLLKITKEFYPVVIRINTIIGKVESIHSNSTIQSSTKEIITTAILALAYRVSLFAIVMNHIQELEHSFVKSLDVIRTDTKRI